MRRSLDRPALTADPGQRSSRVCLPCEAGEPRIVGMESARDWLLVPFTAGSLIVFFFVWAAMHDLAHGDEGTLEWTVLAICAVALPLVFYLAVRALSSAALLAWLIGTGLLVALFTVGAISAMLTPKYSRDPMLARSFLSVGLPMLGIISHRIVRVMKCAF